MANSSFMKYLLLICIVFAGCNHYQNKVDLYYDSSTAVGHRYHCANECGSDSQDFYYSQYLKLLDSNHKYWHLEYGAKAVHPSYKDADPYRCACEPLNPIDGFGANDNDGCENDGPALYRALDSIAKDSVEVREGDFNIEPGVYERFGLRPTNYFNSMDSGNFSGRQFSILDSTINIYSDTLDDIKGYWYDYADPSWIDSATIKYKFSYLIDDSTGRRVTDSGGRMYIDTIKRPIGHPAIFDEH